MTQETKVRIDDEYIYTLNLKRFEILRLGVKRIDIQPLISLMQ